MNVPLYMLIFKTHHAQRRKNRANMSSFNLSPGQPKVLRCISERSDCKLKDIADECDVEPATVSKMINALEEKGMLTRQVNPQNKRAYLLNITEAGREALRKWDEHCLEVEEQSLAGFSDEEKEAFRDYLSRMYLNLTGKEIK